MNAAWRRFADELARWRDAGRTVEFWWRDDDAAQPDAALSRLLALAARCDAPLALAVIPLRASAEVFASLTARVAAIQHGTDHVNRAAAAEKKTEFPREEAAVAAVARLRDGWNRLAELAAGRALPVLAPPWNRFPPDFAPALAAAGYRGLSQYGARRGACPAPGLAQVNTHVDLIGWRSGGGFAGEEVVLEAAVRHLQAKREARADAAEPTGWLSHHLVHDAATWEFLERLFDSTQIAAGVRWRDPAELFAGS